jgi:hypothetical protein
MCERSVSHRVDPYSAALTQPDCLVTVKSGLHAPFQGEPQLKSHAFMLHFRGNHTSLVRTSCSISGGTTSLKSDLHAPFQGNHSSRLRPPCSISGESQLTSQAFMLHFKGNHNSRVRASCSISGRTTSHGSGLHDTFRGEP